MRKSELISFIDHPSQIDKEIIPGLQEVISEYPYFTSAQLLLAKAYHKSDNLNFERQLRLSAAYAYDRKRLHDLIHSDQRNLEVQQVQKEVPAEEIKPLEENQSTIERLSEEDAFLESQILTSAINSSILQEVGDDAEGIEEVSKEIHDRIEQDEIKEQDSNNFNESEGHSFTDWLKHFSKDKKTSEANSTKREAIKAISDQARSIQKKAEFFSASKMAKLSVVESDDLVTETLAQVYEAQGKYERAIQAYEKLQLKFPEKRVYFAGRIKAVEEKLKS